ncbi:MAG: sarcosine oxidase subunit alpha [Rhodospirillales bacterium 69-11]|mgnify:CR=1 FL=1|nr:(2Fe-2S)-binding protein [Rhodospirillales bacterium]MBN8926700.1 (2Fe-2S)-binding protein [Rhodospirillales bacterium]OJW26811.1 MAG: sarcosine oxidase subunit alpha [Rhodospirillales bacterium 69-11]
MLVRAEPGSLTLTFDGRPIPAREGDSVASALLAAGVQVTRHTPRGGVARGPYCMMGACFECLAEVDGVPNVQTCMTPVRDGMVVASQDGARTLGGAAGGDGERDGAAAGP